MHEPSLGVGQPKRGAAQAELPVHALSLGYAPAPPVTSVHLPSGGEWQLKLVAAQVPLARHADSFLKAPLPFEEGTGEQLPSFGTVQLNVGGGGGGGGGGTGVGGSG